MPETPGPKGLFDIKEDAARAAIDQAAKVLLPGIKEILDSAIAKLVDGRVITIEVAGHVATIRIE